MKRIIIVCTTILIASFLISGSILAASGKIKIFVDGSEVPVDVAPKVEQGRVLVPISTISKALEVNVQWDSKSQSVIIHSRPDIWVDSAGLNTHWIAVRDLVSSYFTCYNSSFTRAGETGYRSLVSDKFRSDYVDPSRVISDKLEPVLGYEIRDAIFNGTIDDLSQFKLRVEVVQFVDMNVTPIKIVKRQLDFDVRYDQPKGKFLIDGIWVKGEQAIDDYSPYPGLIFKGDVVIE